MKVNCTRCETKLVIDDSMNGQDFRCPKCEFIFVAKPAEKAPSQERGVLVASNDNETPELGQETPSELEPERWFLRIPEGNEFGPVDRPTLDNWVREGRISHDCELREAGVDVWSAATLEYGVLHEGNPFASSADPHMKRTKPHRGNLVLGLSIAGCVIPFLSMIPAMIGTRDLREMSAGRMDPSGEPATRAGQAIAMVASMIWIGAFAIALLVMLVQMVGRF